MNEIERRVLRWRKPHLSEKLKLTDDLLIDLKDQDLITPEFLKQLEVSNQFFMFIFWNYLRNGRLWGLFEY